MMEEQQQGGLRSDFNAAGNLIAFTARSLAVTVEVFLHRSGSFGERYFGMQAGMGFLLILFYPIFWEGYDASSLLWFMSAYWFMIVCARIGTFVRRQRGGAQPHTRYTGYPRVLRLFRRMSEQTA